MSFEQMKEMKEMKEMKDFLSISLHRKRFYYQFVDENLPNYIRITNCQRDLNLCIEINYEDGVKKIAPNISLTDQYNIILAIEKQNINIIKTLFKYYKHPYYFLSQINKIDPSLFERIDVKDEEWSMLTKLNLENFPTLHQKVKAEMNKICMEALHTSTNFLPKDVVEYCVQSYV